MKLNVILASLGLKDLDYLVLHGWSEILGVMFCFTVEDLLLLLIPFCRQNKEFGMGT